MVVQLLETGVSVLTILIFPAVLVCTESVRLFSNYDKPRLPRGTPGAGMVIPRSYDLFVLNALCPAGLALWLSWTGILWPWLDDNPVVVVVLALASYGVGWGWYTWIIAQYARYSADNAAGQKGLHRLNRAAFVYISVSTGVTLVLWAMTYKPLS
jgi:hypothetical protein